MRKLMISIHPEWVEKILNGDKTVEIRSWIPKGELPLEVLIYVAKRKPYLAYDGGCYDDAWGMSQSFYRYSLFDTKCELDSRDDDFVENCPPLNGKVVAKFILNKAEEIEPIFGYQTNESDSVVFCGIYTDSLTQEELIKQSCIPNLMYKVYDKWEAEECDEPRPTYAWHIDNLEIFYEPKELGEYGLAKAPQKMVWVEDYER